MSLRVAISLALLGLFASAAAAESRDARVFLLAPNAAEQPAMQAAVRAGLEHAKLELADGPIAGVDPVLLACRARGCLGQVAQRTQVAFSVIANVESNPEGEPVAVSLALGDAHGESAQSHVPVHDGDIASAVQDALDDARLALTLGGDSLLRVRSVPDGALVFVDGAVAGSAPSEHRVAPGKHEIATTLSGFAGDSRRVTTQAGQAERVEIWLTPQAAPQHAMADTRPASAWNYVLGGVLAVAVVPLVAVPFEAYGRHGQLRGGDAALIGAGVLAFAGSLYLLCASPIEASAEVTGRASSARSFGSF